MIYEVELCDGQILITIQVSEENYDSDTDIMWVIETIGL